MRTDSDSLEDEMRLRLSVNWGIRGDGIDADEVTQAMGVLPSHVLHKGRQYVTRDGRALTHPSTVWQIRSGDSIASANLDEHAEYILHHLEAKSETVQKLRAIADYSDVRVWYEIESTEPLNTASFRISSRLMQRLSVFADDVNCVVVVRMLT